MKKILAIGGMLVIGIMTAVIGFRLSTDALSIIVGAVLGMAAILPTIVLVAFLLKKNQESLTGHPQPMQQQPPVVVVSGGMMPPQYFQQQQPPSQAPQAMLPPPRQSAPRQFHLMGYEDADHLEMSDDDWAAAG